MPSRARRFRPRKSPHDPTLHRLALHPLAGPQPRRTATRAAPPRRPLPHLDGIPGRGPGRVRETGDFGTRPGWGDWEDEQTEVSNGDWLCSPRSEGTNLIAAARCRNRAEKLRAISQARHGAERREFAPKGGTDGEIRRESEGEGGARDARAEARQAPLRALRQEGDEPQASDRDRPLRSAASGRQGAEEARHGAQRAEARGAKKRSSAMERQPA